MNNILHNNVLHEHKSQTEGTLKIVWKGIIIHVWEISTEAAFVVLSEPKIEDRPGTGQRQHSVQTDQLSSGPAAPRTQAWGCTSSAVAVTHFKIMSGRNSLRTSWCQTKRNKTAFYGMPICWNRHSKHIPNILALERTDTVRDLLTQSSVSVTNMRPVWQSHQNGKYLGVRQSWVQILAQLLDDKVKVKVAQSCPTLWDPMDYTVHGILQTRIVEWIAFPFSRGSSQPRDWTGVSCIADGFFTSWARRETQEHWSR